MKRDTNIFAKVVADSICNGHRITTMHVRAPRPILAEFNTHRCFSRNSASSRAIPTAKFRERVRRSPYLPQDWKKAGTGMSPAGPMDRESAAFQQFSAESLLDRVLDWHEGCEAANGTAKEQLNRYLEPWLYTDILVTSTEWLNFFGQRCDGGADGAIQLVADATLECYVNSTPVPLDVGEWHLPFWVEPDSDLPGGIEDILKVCTARCARVSYFNFGENGVDQAKDLSTFDKLLNPPGGGFSHWSPFEHCAEAMTKDRLWWGDDDDVDVEYSDGKGNYFHEGRCANFTGWVQYRHRFADRMRAQLAGLDLKQLLAKRQSLYTT